MAGEMQCPVVVTAGRDSSEYPDHSRAPRGRSDVRSASRELAGVLCTGSLTANAD